MEEQHIKSANMKAKDSNKARINEEITLNDVRLVGKDGEPLGVVSISEAMETAEQAGNEPNLYLTDSCLTNLISRSVY